MKKLKVMTVVGTRPEIIRLSRVINQLDRHCEHILVHTGQNYDYELNQIFFDDLNIRKPDYFLNAAGDNGAKTIGKIIIAIDEVLELEKPSGMLVLGDTNSCMSVLSAKRRKIPIFHMEAGNRCFDLRVPEEINRKIVDHVADINLPYSSIAREYLLKEGLRPDMIIKTGSPMFEVLSHYRDKIDNSNILKKLKLKKNQFFVISAHREENIESDINFYRLTEIINTLGETYDLPVIVSTHPRTKKRIDALKLTFNKNVQLIKPASFTDYNKLQLMSKVTLSDSGTINEESSILGFSALNLREAHERPEGMEEAAVMMVGLNLLRVSQAIQILDSQTDADNLNKLPVFDYNVPNVSLKIIKIIHSYVDYVQQNNWKNFDI
jgi:UDP-N-acetyl-L-fucosamine synthase